MVAPVDSMVELEVEGETFVLRLNFRTLALLEQAGLDPFSQENVTLSLSKSAMICMALSIDDHPAMTDREALAIVFRSGTGFADKVKELFLRFGGTAEEDAGEGNAPAAKKTSVGKRSTTSSPRGSKRASPRTTSGTKRPASSR